MERRRTVLNVDNQMGSSQAALSSVPRIHSMMGAGDRHHVTNSLYSLFRAENRLVRYRRSREVGRNSTERKIWLTRRRIVDELEKDSSAGLAADLLFEDSADRRISRGLKRYLIEIQKDGKFMVRTLEDDPELERAKSFGHRLRNGETRILSDDEAEQDLQEARRQREDLRNQLHSLLVSNTP